MLKMDLSDITCLFLFPVFSLLMCFGHSVAQFSSNGVVFHRPFCYQFHSDSQAKTPLEVSVFENAPVGTILKSFEKPTITAHIRVVGGARNFFEFDTSKLVLSVKRPLASKRGQTVFLNISCVEIMKLYQIELKFLTSFAITVRDVNDPPVFVNLPGTISTEEAVPHQRIIYKAVGDDPFDVDEVFRQKQYRLLNVTAVGQDDQAGDKFSVDRQGNVILHGGMDYDHGPREYNLLIEVQDGGFPPLRNQSILTVLLEDSDDQGPAFQYQEYMASAIGEKPIMEVECQVTVPPMLAIDQDPVKKSPINYRIISGTPGDYRYWSTFFYVDSDSGRLCQTESIPRSTSRASRRIARKGFHNFTFTVQAYQTDDHRKVATTKLFVEVQDRNTHAPKFSRLLYRTSVTEYPSIQRGSIILSVKATDDDYGLNQLLEYQLVENPNGAFSIGRSSGLIRVLRPEYVNREANKTIELSVRAVETHTAERFESKSPAKVEINLLDVNDNPPRFLQSKYEYIVKDNHPVGISINNATNKVEAKDLDLKENGTVTYFIGQVTNSWGRFSIKDLNRFVVDVNGNIRIGRSLRDLRRNRQFPYYTVLITAEDQAKSKSERLSSTTTVVIRVVEANDFPPQFVNVPTSVVIGESAEPGTLVANMKAIDRDGDEDMYLRYLIAEGNEGKAFSISNRGYLVTARPLDREKVANYKLVTQVTDGVHSVNATVRVHLKDENDHAPMFTQKRYDLEISENVLTRYRIGDIRADDPDDGANGLVSYRIVGGDMPHLFTISQNGTLFLARRDQSIDREVRDKFIVTVEASDRGTPPKTNITEVDIHLLDVNDNTPQFVRSTYRASVQEGPNAKRLNMLGVIRARDNDKTQENRNIRFSLSGLGHEVFHINEVNGRLRVKSPGAIDCEKQCKYMLKVIARDRLGTGLKASSDLVIRVDDINDNKPEFPVNYTFRLGPLTKRGTRIGKIQAKDRDVSPQNHRVIYLLRGGGYGKFHVDFTTGYLIVSDDLLRDPVQEEYTLEVEAHDTGDPRQMTVSNVTIFVPISKPPVMSPDFEFYVSENHLVKSVVGTLIATDPDIGKTAGEKLEYFIRNQKVPFTVDKVSGNIRTYRALDREEVSHYVFEAFVRDNGLPAHTVTTTVTVNLLDVNDNPPVFDNVKGYLGTVTEDDNSPIYKQQVEMATPISAKDDDVDEVHRSIRYNLTGEGSEMFEINPNTGKIRVKTNGSIDCETKCFYKLKVIAIDMNGTGLVSKASLYISVNDLNDNKPEFRGENQFKAGRLAPIGTVVGQLDTLDIDVSHKNNRLLHFLKGGGLGKFSVDVETGKITVADVLIREPMKEVYTLEVEAHDTGEPKLSNTATVEITVTLNTVPITEPSVTFEVLEHVLLGSHVGKIEAQDPDNKNGVVQKLEYSIPDDSIPFRVETETGWLKTSSSIDRESAEKYEFIVYIKDNGIPPFTASTRVTVYVKDINDNPPVFDSDTGYTASVTEDDKSPIDDQSVIVVPAITTSDQDATETNRRVRYRLSGDGKEMFKIDQWNGTLRVKEPGLIDCETRCIYNLTVSAVDKNGKGFQTDAPLIISVTDINDNAPVFAQNQSFHIHRLAPGGTKIGQIIATDSDMTSPNNRINYHLQKGGFGKFSVDMLSGMIIVSDTLLREPMREEYKLFVEAHDSGNPSLSAGIQVTVAVPLNHKPYLAPLTKFDVRENVPIGTLVGQVIAKDEDTDKNKTDSDSLTYYFGKSYVFVIEEDTGVIRTKAYVDREEEDQYVLDVFVRDNGIPSLTSSASVVISVIDENDNNPVFSVPAGYTGQITEDDAEPIHRQTVKLYAPVSATDKDATEENNQVRFQLEGDGSDEFAMDQITGEIHVKNAGSIDCERKCSYYLTVVAYDEGDTNSKSTVNLNITVEDVNDNAPVFMEGLEFQTGRLTSPGERVGKLQAADEDFTDRNNQIIFLLREGGYGKFAVDVETGEILVSDDLTRPPMKEVYELVVEAFDNGNPQLSIVAEIRIHVTLNTPPSVPPAVQVLLGENIPIGSLVTRVKALDPDIGKNPDDYLDFFMNDTTVPFDISAVDGTIRTTGHIDREKIESFKFNIYVRDHGIPSYTASSGVTVQVNDLNDNPPYFGSQAGYKGTVKEDDSYPIPMQQVILMPSVIAHDNDSTEGNRNLRFSLKGNGSELFLIDPLTADIHVKEPGRIDCEARCHFDLKIVATDRGGDGVATETLLSLAVEDTNDNVPTIIDKQMFTTGRGAALGTSLGFLSAADKDVTNRNNKILYYLKEGGFQKFAVDFYTGEVLIAANLTRYPMLEEYKLLVELYDTGEPQLSSTTEVLISVPKNSPPTVANRMNIEVTENGPAGEVVGKVMANDPDVGKVPGEKLQYKIDSKSALIPFNVNSSTGEITSVISHDRELVDGYVFVIRISDNGLPSYTATTTVNVVVIDQNDHVPMFASEEGYAGTLIEDDDSPIMFQRMIVMPEIHVTDKDKTEENRDVRFQLLGEGVELFDIDERTGRIQVKESGTIDCETWSHFNLKVIATDRAGNGLNSTASLKVKVEDLNDNAPVLDPQYRFAVGRLTPVGTTVGQVLAIDKDVSTKNSRVHYSIKGGNGAGRFTVDLNTGNITVASPLTTRPMRDQYNLTLEAYDTGNPPLAAETQVLVDVPLNTPPTVLPSFYLSVYENKEPGTFVANISAFDPDVTPTSRERLHYSYNSSAVPFEVKKSSGLITTARILDREKESRFIFPVYIADNGAPPFTVTTTVTVNVWDENDNYPVFTSSRGYEARVVENDNSSSYETSVTVNPPISATDQDQTSMNRKIHYSISGPGSRLFRIDPMTGSVELSGTEPINCEDQCVFHLQVTATDRMGTGLNTRTNLTVYVEDVNDNAPRFVQDYEFRLQRFLPVETVIGSVKARDQDATAKNNRVLYHIKHGSHGDFEIDLLTGEIRIANSLLREPHIENYLLELEAVDTGNPQLSASTEVKVSVPKNHAPLLQSFFQLTVDESAPPGSEVGQVVADDYDVDVSDAQILHYWITESVPFAVDSQSGIIQTIDELDREMKEKYMFRMFVKDDGVPPFTASTMVNIDIQDVNDNAPVFGSPRGYRARIIEDDTLSVGIQEVELLPALVVTDADKSKENRNIRFSLKGKGSKNFNISPLTGQIHANYREIDCEKRCRYILNLIATDRGGNGSATMTKILIEVEDVNDHPPIVPRVYAFTTPRLSPVGTVVGRIEAIDRDWTKKNSRLLYYLKDGGQGKFAVNISSGFVYVNTPLMTSPMLEQYVLHVEVYDTGEPQLWALTEVVINVPLNKPPTIQPEYNFTTPENRDLGEIIGEIQASDPDLVFNPSEVLSYYVNDSRLPFSVEVHTGLLKTSGSIDLEEDDHFMFPLYVSDNGIPPFTATTTIRVQVLDENDHYPMFNSIGGYTAGLDEDDQTPRKQSRINVSPRIMVSDGDETPENREVRFWLTGRGNELFEIDPITADLSVTEPGNIDCEVQCRFDLKVMAADQLGMGLESSENLVIYIGDMNDNRPVFPANYSFSVPRASAIGSSVGTVKAIDADKTSRNSRILYSIKSSSRGDFVVNIQTGEIVVANSLFLDPQKEDYTLVIEGTDTGDPPLSADTTVRIFVPMNHPPLVDQEISFAVEEHMPIGAMIGDIEVNDIDIGLDLNQELSFSMENDKVPFLVNSTNGVITTSGELDSEEAEKFSFEVLIRDNGEPEHTSSTLITVYVTDVNDNAPVFGSKRGYRGMVTEDNWIPLFDQEVVVIPPISADDLDQSADKNDIRFSIEGPGHETFRIDPKSGEITIQNPGTIDCETMCLYELQVIAADGEGLTSRTNLTITVDDVNDNAPEFTKVEDFYVASMASVGAVVGKFQAEDRDQSTRNNRVMYLLKDGGHGKFSIDVDSGDIVVADSLIREPLVEDYILHIEAYDTGEPRLRAEAEVMVSVAMNHPPVMDIFYEYEIRETVPIGTVVGKVDVTDPDQNQTLEYFMEDTSVPFEVSPDTGIIKTSERLDRELNEEHVFMLFAKDSGTPPYTASSIITIFLEDVNDNYPMFLTGPTYHGYVIEDDFNPKPGQKIRLDKNISVADRDATEENREVVLSLEGEGSELFVIDKYTGLVSTAKTGTIDREKTAVYNLQAVATDQNGEGLSRKVPLVISVVDENDHPPVFRKPKFVFTLNHLAKAGLEVGEVTAYDPDATKPNNELLYVLQDDPFGKFKLDVRTGRLYLLESFFAKPRKDEYVIQVSVIDMGFPAKTAHTEVAVKSTGMRFNDFPPEFLGRTMFYLQEETPVGTLVGKLNIIDKDKNNAGGLNINIDGDAKRRVPFRVDNEGNIYTTNRIDRDAGYFYFLFNVRATDTGSPPLNTSQEIGIIMEDINDNPPEFTLKKYRHMVYDLFPPNTVVATPFAHDDRDTTPSVYTYRMTGGKHGFFYIDSNTGEVKTTRYVERLGKETITYTITATDLYNTDLSATTTLELQILDSFSNRTCCCRVPC